MFLVDVDVGEVLKMRDLWLPWEGMKDLTLAYSCSNTILENKGKEKNVKGKKKITQR